MVEKREEQPARRIAVIGAGLAGLAAAWYAKEEGCDVVVFEEQGHVGGRAHSEEIGRARIDVGAWSFPANAVDIMDLVAQLGLEREVVEVPVTIGRARHGKLHVGSFRSALGLVMKGIVPLPFALQALRLQWQSHSRKLEKDERAYEWARRSFSTGFIDGILKPLAGLFFLQDLRSLSRTALQGTFAYLHTMRLLAFREGMGTLAMALAERLEVRCGERVEHVRRVEGVWEVGTVNGRERFREVVLATPLPETCRVLGEHVAEELRGSAQKIAYGSTLVVHIVLKKRFEEVALQVLPPIGVGETWCCGFTIDRARHEARVEEGYELVTMYANPERVEALWGLADSEIEARFVEELTSWLPEIVEWVEQVRVTRWRQAIPLYGVETQGWVGELERVARELSEQEKLWLVGDYFGVASVGRAVSRGREVGLLLGGRETAKM